MSARTDASAQAEQQIPVRSDAQWRAQLTPEQFRITRKAGTERAFTGPWNHEKAAGTYRCVCCGAALFASADKYDSGTGWPSFTQPAAPGALEERQDRKFFMRRTEVACAACAAHLGHVFPDGPPPTGLRYCINGTALHLERDAPEHD